MGSRPSSTRRRAKLRQGARLRRLAQVFAHFLEIVHAVRARSDGFGAFVDRFMVGGAELAVRHCGDLVPIPPLDLGLVG